MSLSSADGPRWLVARALASGLGLGAIGFLTGYIAPLHFTPEANLGPLLGIFFTGPAAFVIGITIGLTAGLWHWRPVSTASAFLLAAVLVFLGSLYLSLPEDRHVGDVVEGTILDCSPATTLEQQTLAQWEENIRAADGRAHAAPTWRDDVRKSLTKPGTVATLKVERLSQVCMKGKPWNRGQIVVIEAPEGFLRLHLRGGQTQRFYTAASLCESGMSGRQEYLARWEGVTDDSWPPKEPATLLWLFTLHSIADIRSLSTSSSGAGRCPEFK